MTENLAQLLQSLPEAPFQVSKPAILTGIGFHNSFFSLVTGPESESRPSQVNAGRHGLALRMFLESDPQNRIWRFGRLALGLWAWGLGFKVGLVRVWRKGAIKPSTSCHGDACAITTHFKAFKQPVSNSKYLRICLEWNPPPGSRCSSTAATLSAGWRCFGFRKFRIYSEPQKVGTWL